MQFASLTPKATCRAPNEAIWKISNHQMNVINKCWNANITFHMWIPNSNGKKWQDMPRKSIKIVDTTKEVNDKVIEYTIFLPIKREKLKSLKWKWNYWSLGQRVLETFANEPIKFTDVSHDRLNIFWQLMEKWVGKRILECDIQELAECAEVGKQK